MKKVIVSIFAFFAFGGAHAQKSDAALPGDPSLASSKEELARIATLDKGSYTYSVEDYFSRPKQFDFQFSPNGNYFSFRERDVKGKNHVYVKDTETGQISKAIEEGEELIRGYAWANDNRLIYVKDQGGNENYQLFASNLDGSNPKALTPFENVRVSILNELKEQPDFMIISMNKDNPEIFEPYKININTGQLTKLYENKDTSSPIMGYEFDKDGVLRGYTKQENGTDYVLYYRTSPTAPFEKVVHLTWKDTFTLLGFDYTTPNPHDAYVLSNLDSDTEEIQRYDLKEKKMLNKLFHHNTFDLGGLEFSNKRNYEVDFYHYSGEKDYIIPVSATYKKLHKKFEKQFAGYEYAVASKTDNETKYLLLVGSDQLRGAYYLYDAQKNIFQKLLDLKPELKEKDMAQMKPIRFKSRDGLTIHGYITLPKGVAQGQKVPLIVNPHGGPYGQRDKWEFNPEAQLFASRGYATLQVNYRGSGGYGKKFHLAGSKQIGRKMLEDLEDAVAFVKKQGWVEENKIAIYGGSYGGLATLGSLVKTPDLYACGVDYVGVSNLFTFFDAFPPYWKPYLGQVYAQWYNPESEEDKKIMTAVSPALNVEKITKPLFVVQGANDPRVKIGESDQIVKNLRSRGVQVPYMVKYNEGHGFHHEENRIELYKTMLGFFATHLKAEPKTASSKL